MSDALVKQNINLMEYPLWSLSENPSKKLVVPNSRGEYVLTSGYKATDRVDMNFLLYLLMISQNKGYVKTLELTRYEMLKSCDMGASEKDYERLEEGLKRWMHTVIEFKGNFYDDKDYLIKAFHIINNYSIDKKTKKLKVKFNEDFLLMIKKSNFYKYIDFNKYKKLKRPVSSRLYEILLKTFKDRKEWEIEAINLSKKITLQDKSGRGIYPYDVKAKVIPAINEINKKTELEIGFETRKNKQDQTIFKFKLLKDQQIVKQETELQDETVKSLAEMLRDGFKQNTGLLEALRTHLNKFGYDYVKYNIIYANWKATKAYIGFLKQALKKNWGEELRIAEEKKQEENKRKDIELEEKRQREEEERAKIEQEYQEKQKICDFINALEKQDKDKFIDSVLSYLEGKDNYKTAKMILSRSKKIEVSTIFMFLNAFEFCYNSYIQTKNLKKCPL